MMNTKNTRRETRINTGENTRETLKPTRMITQVLDPQNTIGDTRSKVNNGRYTVAGSSPKEVLSSSLKGVLNPLGGSSSVEARISEEKVTKWMSKALTQNIS